MNEVMKIDRFRCFVASTAAMIFIHHSTMCTWCLARSVRIVRVRFMHS